MITTGRVAELAGGNVDEERLAAIDAAEDSRRELNLALLDFAEALGGAAAAARRTPDAPQIAAALLGVAIVVQAADVANSIARAARLRLPHESPAAALPVGHPGLQLDPRVGQLFGSRVADPPVEAAATHTPLLLTGVIADEDPQRGFGILGTEPKRTSLYPVGAALPDASRLVAVYVDRVEVERAGLREILRLPLGLSTTGHLVRMAVLSRVDGEDPTLAPTKPQRHRAAADGLPPGPEEGRAAATEYWAQLHLGMENTDSAGHFLGYKLRGVGGKQGDGLHSGDILMAVNGTPVTDRGRVSQLLDTDDSMRLTLLRNGSTLEVTLPPGSPLPTAAMPVQADGTH